MQDPIATLPLRLRRAVFAWLALSTLVALLPSAAAESVGLLAHPGFWCGLLPLLVLAPQLPGWLAALRPLRVRPRRLAIQARRRTRRRNALARAA